MPVVCDQPGRPGRRQHFIEPIAWRLTGCAAGVVPVGLVVGVTEYGLHAPCQGDDRDLVSLVGGPEDAQHNAAVTSFFRVDDDCASPRRGRDDTECGDLPEALWSIRHATL